MTGGSAEEAVGTAAEEAAKLIASLTSWVGDHIATDAEECQLCPICLGRAGESAGERFEDADFGAAAGMRSR